MSILRVWAPNARSVATLIGKRRIAMDKEDPPARGWWRVDAPEAAAGCDYAFIIDGGEPLPDRARNGSPREFMDRRELSTTMHSHGPTIISTRRRCHRRSFTNFTSVPSPRRERSRPLSPAWTIWPASA